MRAGGYEAFVSCDSCNPRALSFSQEPRTAGPTPKTRSHCEWTRPHSLHSQRRFSPAPLLLLPLPPRRVAAARHEPPLLKPTGCSAGALQSRPPHAGRSTPPLPKRPTQGRRLRCSGSGGRSGSDAARVEAPAAGAAATNDGCMLKSGAGKLPRDTSNNCHFDQLLPDEEERNNRALRAMKQ